MDLARNVYSRELKIAAMRAMDGGQTVGQVARRLQVSPKLLEKWRIEWRARGEAAFPGKGNRGHGMPYSNERRVAELERVKGAEAKAGAELQMQALDADDEEILDRQNVTLQVELDEWF